MLRFATVFGLSPRMRFDLAVNGMVLGFFKNKQIPIMRDGKQWRPFIHVKDVAEAYVTTIKAPKEKINGEIFNVGDNLLNYQILSLAKEVSKSIKISFKKNWYGDPDSRSYRINFKKINDVLEYKTKFSISDGAIEIFNALKNGNTTDSIQTKTVEWYKYLIDAKNISDSVSLNDKVL